MAETIASHLVITGRVQGVMFRASMVAEARRLGVVGWVRNRADGSVEAVVQGTPAAVAAVLAWARHGPAHARVAGLDATATAAVPFTAFEQRSTV